MILRTVRQAAHDQAFCFRLIVIKMDPRSSSPSVIPVQQRTHPLTSPDHLLSIPGQGCNPGPSPAWFHPRSWHQFYLHLSIHAGERAGSQYSFGRPPIPISTSIREGSMRSSWPRHISIFNQADTGAAAPHLIYQFFMPGRFRITTVRSLISLFFALAIFSRLSLTVRLYR